jgi:hypothetical protein
MCFDQEIGGCNLTTIKDPSGGIFLPFPQFFVANPRHVRRFAARVTLPIVSSFQSKA